MKKCTGLVYCHFCHAAVKMNSLSTGIRHACRHLSFFCPLLMTIKLTSRLVFTARLRPQFRMPSVRNARRASIAARRCCSSTAAARWCCTPLPVSAYHSIGGRLPEWQISKLSPPSVSFESSRIFFTIHRRHRRKKWWTRILKFEFCDFKEFFLIFKKASHGPYAADLDHHGRSQTRSQ